MVVPMLLDPPRGVKAPQYSEGVRVALIVQKEI